MAQRTASRSPWRTFWQKYAIGYLFVLPAVMLYAVFILYPFFGSFYFSLTRWNGADPVKEFIGLDNYVRIAQDKVLWRSLFHNLIWMIFGSIGAIGLGLLLALLVWSRPRGFLIFRTVFFLPQVLGAAVVGIIWTLIYRPRRGMLYLIGDALNLSLLQFSFLGNLRTALGAVLIASIWASIGFFFVILLAGLQSVDNDLLDAARVDGANEVQRLWHVVLPQLFHVMTLVIVLAMIGSLNVFDIIWAMTKGGPANATEVIGTYTYTKAFTESNVGYAAALTMVMTILALCISTVFVRLRERRES